MTDKLEIHIIELEKIEEKIQKSNDKLLDWLYFLINPDSRRVKNKMRENEELKEAKEKLDKITEDARMQQLAWWREKAIYEENTMLNSSFRKGKKEGKERRDKRNQFKGCPKNEGRKNTNRNNYENNRIDKRRNRTIIIKIKKVLQLKKY